MKTPIGRLSLWQEVVAIGMSNKLRGNSSLDQLRKLRLDIGRYEFRSPGLSDGFLSRAVTMAVMESRT